jgi:hypothetical protein
MSFHVPTNNEQKDKYERDQLTRDSYNSDKKQAIKDIREELEHKLDRTINNARIIFSTLLVSAITNIQQCSQIKDLRTIIQKTNPSQIQIKYVNQDTLPDLVYKTGEIYLQTKEGNFVSYTSIASQEKTRIDSIYKAKQDSIKSIYKK